MDINKLKKDIEALFESDYYEITSEISSLTSNGKTRFDICVGGYDKLKAQSIPELAQENFEQNYKYGIKTACIGTCKNFDLYYDDYILDLILKEKDTNTSNIMKRYCRTLNLKQFQGKSFKDSEIR